LKTNLVECAEDVIKDLSQDSRTIICVLNVKKFILNAGIKNVAIILNQKAVDIQKHIVQAAGRLDKLLIC